MKRLKVSLFVVAALTTPLLGEAATVHADGLDDDYVKAVRDEGIPGDPAVLIQNGHASCAQLRSGTSLQTLQVALAQQQGGIDPGLALGELGAAINVYCPDQQYRLAQGNQPADMPGPADIDRQFKRQDGWYPGCHTTPMC